MFRAFSRPSSAGRPAGPRTQHDRHHDTKVKPEAATAVIELLMMDGFELNVKLRCQKVKHHYKINQEIAGVPPPPTSA